MSPSAAKLIVLAAVGKGPVSRTTLRGRFCDAGLRNIDVIDEIMGQALGDLTALGVIECTQVNGENVWRLPASIRYEANRPPASVEPASGHGPGAGAGTITTAAQWREAAMRRKK